jgi:hypothetical protein
MTIPDDFVDYLAGGTLDPEYEYRQKQRELANDFRKNKVKAVDIDSEYNEFRAFASTPEYKNTQIATQLLSRDFDVTDTQLIYTLQSNYGLSDGECNQVFQNLANSKMDNCDINSYAKAVRLRRK